MHTCGTRVEDTLWCWGRNNEGQLGDGTTSVRPIPTQIGTSEWKAVDAGYSHTCAIRSDDTLWCWGADESLWCWGLNSSGQLGLGTNATKRSPQQSSTLTPWSTVSAGAFHTLALLSD